MNTAKSLDKELTHYLSLLSTKQKQTVLTVVKTFAQEEPWWDDKKYMAEMDKRFNELKRGKVKSISLDELEDNARKAYKNRDRK